MSAEAASVSAPLCPEHPDRPSVATCSRCGRFLCQDCRASDAPPRCAPCLTKESDPLGVTTQSFAPMESLRSGIRLYFASLRTLWPVAFLLAVPGGLLTYALEASNADASTNFRVSRLFDGTIGLVGVGAYLAVLVGTAEGGKRDLGFAFKQGFSSWARLFGARFRMGLWVLLFMLLLIVPGVLKALSLFVVTEAAYREPHREALAHSTELTEGQRGPLFGLTLLAYGIMLVGIMVPSFILGMVGELAAPAKLVTDIIVDGITRLGEAFILSVGLVTFYGLKRLRGDELRPLVDGAP